MVLPSLRLRESARRDLILWADEHRENVLLQVILCTSHGIRHEREKAVVKSFARYRKHTRVVRIFIREGRVKVPIQAQVSSQIE